MNKDIIKKAIFWQILYIVIYGFGAVIINIYFTDVILFAFGIAGVVYILFSLFSSIHIWHIYDFCGNYHTVCCYKEAFNKR